MLRRSSEQDDGSIGIPDERECLADLNADGLPGNGNISTFINAFLAGC